MTVTVYADLFFIFNMLFDGLLLYITARLTNTPFKIWRLVLAAVFGSGYSFFCLAVINTLPLHIAAAAVMVFILFGKNRIVSNTAVFLLSSATAGGIVYGMVYLLGGSEENLYNMGSGTVVISLLCAAAIGAGYLYVCRKNASAGGVHAYITVGGKEYKAFLLKDSGNLLTDPISLDPVIVISKEVFGEDASAPEKAFSSSMRIIPVKTAAGSDILYGFRPEKCVIREFGQKKKREVRVVIALTGKNRFTGTYDGLMPPL